jgi:hypothetical protein
MIHIKKIILGVISLSIFSNVLFCLALASDVTIISNPVYPKSYESVTLTLSSYSFDTDLAFVTWSVDGAVIGSGLGLKSIELKTKGGGGTSKVQASITTANKESLTVNYTLSAQNIDLVWESLEGYVPPFYEGKGLIAEGTTYRVTALPSFVLQGHPIDPSKLAYTWYVDDKAILSQSGTGKQTFTGKLDYLSAVTEVKVLVRSVDGFVSEAKTEIQPVPILPLIYPYNNLLGVDTAHAYGNRLETTKEVSLQVEPYYSSVTQNKDFYNNYEWTLDGLPINTQNPTQVVLHPKENSYGSKLLSLHVTNAKRRLQEAKTSIEIVFDSRQ